MNTKQPPKIIWQNVNFESFPRRYVLESEVDKIKAIENSFFQALAHMLSGGVAECQGLAYKINDGQLQVFRDYDDPPYTAWTQASEQTIFWAIQQEWNIL